MSLGTSGPPLRFGVFELDTESGELRKAGVQIKLPPQPFKVLALLASRVGELVTREEIQQQIWGQETFVDFEQGLNFCIKQIRAALGESAETPRCIETLPRRGYRFIGAVEGLDRRGEPRPEAEAKAIGAAATPGRWRWVATVAVSVILLGVGYFAWHRLWVAPRPAAGRIMLAVLPFQNLTGDPEEEFFSDGFTEEMITQLGRLHPGRLGVIARTSAMQYKNTQKRTDQIGRELGVAYILEGSMRRTGDRVRISAQLIQVQDQTHLWAESYERDVRDVLSLQSDVAAAIAREIEVRLSPDQRARLASIRPVNPEAYENYLKGRFFWNKRTVEGHQKAIEFFDGAIALDPNYAQAYAGRADAYALLGSWPNSLLPRREAMTRAREAAQKALSLNESLADAHTSLGFVKMHYDWDFPGAEKEFLRAIALNPGYATGHHWYAYDLVALGRFEDAIAQARLAQQADPLSVIISRDVGEMLLFAGHDDEAIAQCRKTLEMDPNFGLAHSVMAWAYRHKGQQKEFLDELRRAGNSPGPATLGVWYALTGRKSEARQVLAELKREALSRYGSSTQLVELYAWLGDKDRAFASLKSTFEERDGALILMRVAPESEPLRSDPRFEQLARRVGLPP